MDTIRVQLRETARISDDFGGIAALDVGADGSLFVADYMNQAISAYDQEGNLRFRVGSRGQGPGEFQGLRDISLRRDTLFSFDTQLQRITAFSIDKGQTEYTVPLRSPNTRTIPNYAFEAPSDGGFLVQYAPPTSPTSTKGRKITVGRVEKSGTVVVDSIVVLPDREWLVTTDSRYGYSVSPLPFGKRTVIQLGPEDHLYTGWTGYLGIEIYDLSGERVATDQLDYRPLEVRESDVKALKRAYEEYLGPMASKIVIERIRNAVQAGKLPETKPCYSDFLVDDQGRVWFELITERHRLASTSTGLRWVSRPESGDSRQPLSRWLLLPPSADGTLGLASVSADIDLHVVRAEKAYGVRTDALGVESIVVYDIENLPLEAREE